MSSTPVVPPKPNQTPPLAATDKTVSHVLGEITWLMSQSPIHKQMFIGDLEWFAMPAVLTEQFRIFNGPQGPAAVAFWANVSADTEQRLKDGGTKLGPHEWKGGDRPWLIELVAPFGGVEEIMADLHKGVFASKPFSYHTTENGQRVVKQYAPPSVN